MPAPDLGPPPGGEIQRPVTVHLVADHANAAVFTGAVVVVVDQLRATSTIAAALAAGAARVVPMYTVDDALAERDRRSAESPPPLLAGERSGVKPDTFDLGNSPQALTPEIAADRSVVFTTTNGTAALLHAATADLVLTGALANRSAVAEEIAADPRPIHVLCAGTRGGVTLDDLIAAGAIAERLIEAGRNPSHDDGVRVALHAWADAQARGIEAALGASWGGRNLTRLGLTEDVAWCARVDHLSVVPIFDRDAGVITLAAG